ncbi:MAG: GNAT family N-acetyltransferase [Gemmatimonadaceae bacterium]|nr:GNAT family N-acetyltransferase [Gemmatimonadaceae bacterium]
MSEIVCATEPSLSPEDFRRILVQSGLGATRPIENPRRLQQMLAGASILTTARSSDGELLGVARGVTDGAWIAYLAELAVAGHAQGRGVGRQLLQSVRARLGDSVMLVLASVPDAVGFYERCGMLDMPHVFRFPRESP